MALIGWLVVVVFVASLVAIAALLIVGGAQALRHELAVGFRSRPPSPIARGLTLLAVCGPVLVLIVFIVLTIGRFAIMAAA